MRIQQNLDIKSTFVARKKNDIDIEVIPLSHWNTVIVEIILKTCGRYNEVSVILLWSLSEVKLFAIFRVDVKFCEMLRVV